MLTSYGDKVYASRAQRIIADAIISTLDQFSGPEADGVAIEDAIVDSLLCAIVAIRLCHRHGPPHPDDYNHYLEQFTRILTEFCKADGEPIPKVFLNMAREVDRRLYGG